MINSNFGSHRFRDMPVFRYHKVIQGHQFMSFKSHYATFY